jgi:hypothetical protein
MELKELLRALADGKKVTNKEWKKSEYMYLDRDTLYSDTGAVMDHSWGDIHHECFDYSLYTKPELTPQDICGYVWENGSVITEFYYVKSRDAYGAYCDKKALYSAKEIQEQFTRWEA